MDKLKTYIVDDEIKAVELLDNYIAKIPYLISNGYSRDPIEAFKFLQKNEIDIIFLDINMPMLNGVDLYKNLNNPPLVIFTTAYPQYAVDGFDLEAVDFLLKPISFGRFLKATERLLKRKRTIKADLQDDFKDVVFVKSGNLSHKLFWNEITHLEKSENYVIYHTIEKKILSRQTLSKTVSLSPKYFCRIHKSFAISFLFLKSLGAESCLVAERKLPIGRTYKSKLKQAFEVYQNSHFN